MNTKFGKSVAKLKRDLSREHASTYGKWPDEGQERQFDNALGELKKRRDDEYGQSILKKYPQEFLAKVLDWARVQLSPLELDRHKNFESLATEFIEQNKDNPDRVSYDDVKMFFDAQSGKPRKIIAGPDEVELGELSADEYGSLKETPRQAAPKVTPKVPTYEEARRMTSDQLAQFIPKGE